jgi:hypothetical protein
MAKKAGGNTANRRRGPGKPFTGQGDPRNNTHGQISKGRLTFNRTLKELIVAEGESKHKDGVSQVTLKKVEWMVKVVWNAAMKGEAWAVQFIAERTEGKVTQPVGNTADTDGKMQALLIRVIHTKDGNGGGNGDGAK